MKGTEAINKGIASDLGVSMTTRILGELQQRPENLTAESVVLVARENDEAVRLVAGVQRVHRQTEVRGGRRRHVHHVRPERHAPAEPNHRAGQPPDDVRRAIDAANKAWPAWRSKTAMERSAIMGALTLYLDFLNLFTMLLSLMGSRDE